MTIMQRVREALEAHGEKALADELQTCLNKINGTVTELIGLHRKKDQTTRKLIGHFQTMCRHEYWTVAKQQKDTIYCCQCGHTVCEPKAVTWGQRITQGQYYLYSHPHKSWAFRLNSEMRKLIGEKIKPEEIPDGEVPELHEAALPDIGDGAASKQTPSD